MATLEALPSDGEIDFRSHHNASVSREMIHDRGKRWACFEPPKLKISQLERSAINSKCSFFQSTKILWNLENVKMLVFIAKHIDDC